MRVTDAACRCCSRSRRAIAFGLSRVALCSRCARNSCMRWSAIRAWLTQRFRERVPLRLLRICNFQSGADVSEARFNPFARLRKCTLAVVMARALLRTRGSAAGAAPVCACTANADESPIDKRAPASALFIVLFSYGLSCPASCRLLTQTGGLRASCSMRMCKRLCRDDARRQTKERPSGRSFRPSTAT